METIPPTGLAVDRKDNRVYWSTIKTILSSDLSGENR